MMDRKLTTHVILMFIAALILLIVVGGLSALVFVLSILDITHNGMHFWNLSWAVLSGLVLAGLIFGRANK